MKKIGLICALLLAGLSLSACNNLASQQSKSSKTSSLKTYHSSSSAKPRKQTKKNTKGNHSHKSKNINSAAATNTSNKENKTTTSLNNSTKPATQGSSHSSTNNPDTATSSSTDSNATSIDYDATDSYHGDPSRYRTGTRKPSTFSNSQDYQAYLAYYQGYNYDKSTGQITRMNDQQLNDMRQQMNKDGGQSFGQ